MCSPFHQNGTTALYIASHNGPLDVVNYLVEHGADVNAAANVSPSEEAGARQAVHARTAPPLLASSPPPGGIRGMVVSCGRGMSEGARGKITGLT